MNVQPLSVTKQQASECLKEYKAHRDAYDKRDWEIERIYRAISRGKTVISVGDAIRNAGVDERARPRLAVCPADAQECDCSAPFDKGVAFGPCYPDRRKKITVEWPDFPAHNWWGLRAKLPRIPPQHRPTQAALSNYHILWEADWHDLPRDPYLLRRIGADAWIVLAAWDLTDVEISVLRARPQ